MKIINTIQVDIHYPEPEKDFLGVREIAETLTISLQKEKMFRPMIVFNTTLAHPMNDKEGGRILISSIIGHLYDTGSLRTCDIHHQHYVRQLKGRIRIHTDFGIFSSRPIGAESADFVAKDKHQLRKHIDGCLLESLGVDEWELEHDGPSVPTIWAWRDGTSGGYTVHKDPEGV